LSERGLVYAGTYDAVKAGEKVKSIDLQGCEVVDEGHKKYPFYFRIQHAERRDYELSAGSQVEKSLWVDAVRYRISLLTNHREPNTSSVFSPTADSRTTLGGASEDRSHFGDTTFESTFDNKAQLDESLDSTMGSLPEDTLSKNETFLSQDESYFATDTSVENLDSSFADQNDKKIEELLRHQQKRQSIDEATRSNTAPPPPPPPSPPSAIEDKDEAFGREERGHKAALMPEEREETKDGGLPAVSPTSSHGFEDVMEDENDSGGEQFGVISGISTIGSANKTFAPLSGTPIPMQKLNSSKAADEKPISNRTPPAELPAQRREQQREFDVKMQQLKFAMQTEWAEKEARLSKEILSLKRLVADQQAKKQERDQRGGALDSMPPTASVTLDSTWHDVRGLASKSRKSSGRANSDNCNEESIQLKTYESKRGRMIEKAFLEKISPPRGVSRRIREQYGNRVAARSRATAHNDRSRIRPRRKGREKKKQASLSSSGISIRVRRVQKQSKLPLSVVRNGLNRNKKVSYMRFANNAPPKKGSRDPLYGSKARVLSERITLMGVKPRASDSTPYNKARPRVVYDDHEHFHGGARNPPVTPALHHSGLEDMSHIIERQEQIEARTMELLGQHNDSNRF